MSISQFLGIVHLSHIERVIHSLLSCTTSAEGGATSRPILHRLVTKAFTALHHRVLFEGHPIVFFLASFQPQVSSLRAQLDTCTREKNGLQLDFGSLVDIDEDGELLAEAAECKHVVSRIPLAVRNKIKHAALVGLVWHHILHSRIPDPRLAIFRARDKILGIWGDRTAHQLVLRVRSEESLLDAGSTRRFILDQTCTVVTRLHEELV